MNKTRDFINTAAHELRTPTQAITGYSELDDEIFENVLKNSKETTKEDLKRIINNLYNHHNSISRNASRLDILINNLLDVARIESSQNNMIMIQKEKVDLVKEINDLINSQLNQKIENKNINVHFINDVFELKCFVYADRSRLNQILNNLLDNAIKYTKDNGFIDILIKENDSILSKEKDTNGTKYLKNRTESNRPIKKAGIEVKGEIYVGISDTGKGISPAIMPNLFEKFTTDSNTGTGLGLHITRKLVETMGGRIWAYNNNDGLGSTFVFSLPRFEDTIENN